MTRETKFAPGDWRAKNGVLKGEPYRRNLRIVDALARFAEFELGTTVSRLAVAWTLANPAVQVAIVRTRNAEHADDALAAAELELAAQGIRPLDDIISREVGGGGTDPRSGAAFRCRARGR